MLQAKEESHESSSRKEFESELIALRPKLLVFAIKLTRHRARADDLFQETLLKALNKRHTFEPGSNMNAWLSTIMYNTYVTERYKSRRFTQIDDGVAEGIPDTKIGIDTQLILDANFLEYAEALGRMQPHHRDAVIGCHYLGMEYSEIAQAVSCPLGTVKSRINRGLEWLRKSTNIDRNDPTDMPSWEHATDGYDASHPYYPIAQARERIYSLLRYRALRAVEQRRYIE